MTNDGGFRSIAAVSSLLLINPGNEWIDPATLSRKVGTDTGRSKAT